MRRPIYMYAGSVSVISLAVRVKFCMLSSGIVPEDYLCTVFPMFSVYYLLVSSATLSSGLFPITSPTVFNSVLLQSCPNCQSSQCLIRTTFAWDLLSSDYSVFFHFVCIPRLSYSHLNFLPYINIISRPKSLLYRNCCYVCKIYYVHRSSESILFQMKFYT